MAISSIGDRGTGVAGSSASTTVTMAPGATVAVGRILVVSVVSPTAAHNSVTDTGSNTYVKLAESSGNSQTTSVWFTKVTTQLTTGSTITATFGSSIADKCIGAWEFSVGTGNTIQESVAEQTNTSTGSGFGSLAFSSLSSKERLYFRACGKNANSTTALTATASPAFTSLGWTIRSRNNTAARILRGEFRIETSTGVTSNPTFAVTGNYATLFVALEEVAESVTGTASATLDNTTGAAEGVRGAAGTAAATLSATAGSASGTVYPVGIAAATLADSEGPPSTALGGLDANADKLTQQTDLPASLITAYTVTGWFKRTTNANEGGPVCVWNGSSYNALLVDTSGNAEAASNLGTSASIATIATDTWYFFALTQNASRQLKGYIGGLTGPISTQTHTSVNDNAATTDIIVGGGPYFGQQVRGSITEFRVWNRELSAAEIEAERDGRRVAASTTGLIGRYPLVDNSTKLTAAVGTNLQTTGAGAWNDDNVGPFPGGVASGAVGAAGTASATLGNTTGAASGTVRVEGTAAAILADSVGVAEGTHSAGVTVTGTASATLADTTGAASGSTVTGSASATLGSTTGSAAGARGAAGTASATLGSTTGSAVGTAQVTGSASATLGSTTGSAAGARGAAGTASAALDNTAGAASGSTVTGSASATLGSTTGSAVGFAAGGTANATLNDTIARVGVRNADTRVS